MGHSAVIWGKRDIDVKSGFMSPYMIHYRLPFGETFEAWLKSNVFRLDSQEAYDRFSRILEVFNGHTYVRAINVRIRLRSSNHPLSPDMVKALFEKCPNLHKIKLEVRSNDITPWLSAFYHYGKSEPDIAEYARRIVELREL